LKNLIYEDEEISAYSRNSETNNPNEEKRFLKARPYINDVNTSNKTTTFFTTFPPDLLFTTLANLL